MRRATEWRSEYSDVDADHGSLVVEEEVRERLRQLGLADTGRTEEEEGAGRAVPGRRVRRGCGARRPETAWTANSWPIRREPMIDSIERELLGLSLQETTGRECRSRTR